MSPASISIAPKSTGSIAGEIPIYEPGLEEMVRDNQAAERLTLHDRPRRGRFRRRSRLSRRRHAARRRRLRRYDRPLVRRRWHRAAPASPNAIVVTKSTVPVGTCAKIFRRLKEHTGRDCDVASNPEFLKEGSAIDDFIKPDRVVVGVRRQEVGDVLHELYKPFLRTEKPFLIMSPESAELTKYVANALLSTKISFINEMANLCERMNADINDVRRGIGHDSRIGFAFLFPGVGYGGSCFPKDVRALVRMAEDHGVEPQMMRAVDSVNEHQKQIVVEKIKHALRRQAARQNDRRLGPGVQAADRRHPRSARPGAHRLAARTRSARCAFTIPKRWTTSAESTATNSPTAPNR